MAEHQFINRSAEEQQVVSNPAPAEGIRMKSEEEYPDISMKEDSFNNKIMMQEGTCVDKEEKLVYNNYEYERYAWFLDGAIDPQIVEVNNKAKAAGGRITKVLIGPHISRDGYVADADTRKEYFDQYVKIMANAKVSTKGVDFKFITKKADPCGECDGGYSIDVTVTYTSC